MLLTRAGGKGGLVLMSTCSHWLQGCCFGAFSLTRIFFFLSNFAFECEKEEPKQPKSSVGLSPGKVSFFPFFTLPLNLWHQKSTFT